MKRIVIDIKTGQVKGNIDVVENDNKSDIYKIYILKNKVIYDLAGKTPRMVMIDKKQGIKQVIDLNITDAKRGEVSLQVSDVWTRIDGRYICQLAIFGLEGFLEQSTYFWVTIKNSLFNDIGGEILADPQFEMLKQELEKFQTAFAKIDEWDRYFTETSGKIEEKYTERLNEINSQLSEKLNKDEVTNVMNPKGNIAYIDLPKTDNEIGDYYYCPDGDGINPAGNYAWNGSKWYFSGTGDEGYNKLKQNIEEQFDSLIINDNLFDGNFRTDCGVTLGDNGYINPNVKYNVFSFNVKEGETYTITIPTKPNKEEEHYWFRCIFADENVETINGYLNRGVAKGGMANPVYLSNEDCPNIIKATAPSGAKSIWIQVTKSIKPNYVEVRKGDYNCAKYTTYNDAKITKTNKFLKSGDILLKTFVDPTTKEQINYVMWRLTNGNYFALEIGFIKDTNINLSTFHCKHMAIMDSDFNIILNLTERSLGLEIEGVLKIKGQADYIGGVHGDEQYINFTMMVSGKEADINKIWNDYVDRVDIFIKSNVYECDSSNLAFIKEERLTFDKDGIHVTNRWNAQNSYTLEHCRATLMTIYKYDGNKKILNRYCDSLFTVYPKLVPALGESGILYSSPDYKDCIFTSDYFNCHIKNIYRNGNVLNHSGNTTDFGDRLKAYIDNFTNETIGSGGSVKWESLYTFK